MNTEEILILIVIAAVIIGPERLPSYAEQLGRLVRQLKQMATGATQMVKEELGPELGDIDLTKLDPRKYDPRRIVRDALLDDTPFSSKPAKPKPARTTTAAGTVAAATGTAAAVATASMVATASGSDGVTDDALVGAAMLATPFDDEAT
ncbi:twin-arginine translocase TatA/TatE family subunit [Occultella aeris]|uniref:Sec-independent translocase n=1 Tax=Occultella aeris TaxID=2761496 RepID=A0A7M4DLW4_9MICO|nr:twin-arginine translocase TatA/TatE family subunit [Occultella aeris]VZO38294.1 sec-independent translocase [Occultella aeris]